MGYTAPTSVTVSKHVAPNSRRSERDEASCSDHIRRMYLEINAAVRRDEGVGERRGREDGEGAPDCGPEAVLGVVVAHLGGQRGCRGGYGAGAVCWRPERF